MIATCVCDGRRHVTKTQVKSALWDVFAYLQTHSSHEKISTTHHKWYPEYDKHRYDNHDKFGKL